jgi:hypothetical protein
VPIAAASIRPDPAAASGDRPGAPVVTLPDDPPAATPDVYYLIFDRYAGERVLRFYEATNQPEKAREWREKLSP